MIKKVLGTIAIAGLLISCGNQTQKQDTVTETEVQKVSVEQVLADMQNFVGKEIAIEGMVNHVCAHGGKRMFIIGENPDAAIKITPNEEIGVFEKELEGNHVLVTGVLKELRIDEAYVANLEKELNEGSDNEAVHDHSGGTHDEEATNKEKAQIEAMRNQIAESENGYYSQFWIEASKFEVQYSEEQDNAEVEKN